ncbi:hypothetical protein RchiOBHm_Chr3g0474311 [Rosa chinensis]|uniref:Phthiocerol/phthiodiolone dimycocerosyl transferase C-terminal domain-containing protein n=1 Tax=Rosa chinensis TaxID=74649 RepID=A0A2P6RC40_ROSCH|nr:uncharacterized protein LOC112192954 [Rosa chinensis]PRQ43994.1 hypothetical protein RchiOBHm_Chr3g0474311 [Rosa chinensis]
MSDQNPNPESMPEPIARPVGGTEYSWCKAVPVGTGITVLAFLLTKPPNIPLLQNALHNLQNSHPILRSKHHFDPATNTHSFLTPPTPHLQIQPFDLPSTASILQTHSAVSPFHQIFEHELNLNTWRDPDPLSAGTDVLFASTYTLSESQWALVLRLHTSACDRAAAAALLKELLRSVGGGGTERELKGNGEVISALEDLIPNGKANKPFWARGVDMLGYSLNSFRLSNIEFEDVSLPRTTQMVKLRLNPEHTDQLLAGCKSRGIKLCGVLAAAGLIAAHASKHLPDHQWEKYAVVTLLDCRSLLDPPLSANDFGFYHSAIMNSHDINGENTLWELAKRCYTAFADAKNSNKHFSDMSDLNFLMCKAIENPGLTPSSSMRTAFVSVFEDLVIDDSSEVHQELGLEDYEGCASVHGVGPSIAIFDAIRDGGLNCACVYPSPLHSREQMQGLMDHMKSVLVDGCTVDSESEISSSA